MGFWEAAHRRWRSQRQALAPDSRTLPHMAEDRLGVGRDDWAERGGVGRGDGGPSVVLASAGPAGAAPVTTTLPVGNFPQAVAVNHVTNKAYVLNRSNRYMSVIDGNKALGNNAQCGPSAPSWR